MGTFPRSEGNMYFMSPHSRQVHTHQPRGADSFFYFTLALRMHVHDKIANRKTIAPPSRGGEGWIWMQQVGDLPDPLWRQHAGREYITRPQLGYHARHPRRCGISTSLFGVYRPVLIPRRYEYCITTKQFKLFTIITAHKKLMNHDCVGVFIY